MKVFKFKKKSWLDLKKKKRSKLLGVKGKKLEEAFPTPFDYAAFVRRVASPYEHKGKTGVLAMDRFEDEHFIFFVDKKTGERTVLVDAPNTKEAKKEWKKLIAKQKKRKKKAKKS